MKIRKAAIKDSESLARLYLQFWEAHKNSSPLHRPKFKINLKGCINDAKKTIKDKKYFTYVAQENGEVIGYISFLIKTSESFFRIRKHGYIDECVVDKKHRKKGVARKLVNFAINFFKQKGIRYVRLKVDINNETAMNSWEKLNFEKKSIEYLRKIK